MDKNHVVWGVALATVIFNKIIIVKKLLFSQNESLEAVWVTLAIYQFPDFERILICFSYVL